MPLFGYVAGTENVPVYAKGGVLDPKRCYANARGWMYSHPNGIQELLQSVTGLAALLGDANVMSITVVSRSVESDDLTLIVTFNEDVVVTGNPCITFTGTGLTGTGKIAYGSGSGSNQLTMTYAPISGDLVQAAAIVTPSTLVANAGTLVDSDATSIVPVDLTSQGDDGATDWQAALDTLLDLEVVQYAPNVRSIALTARTVESADVSAVVTFNEAVDVSAASGVPYIQLTDAGVTVAGGDARMLYASGSGTTALTFTYPLETGDLGVEGVAVIGGSDNIALDGETITATAGSGADVQVAIDANSADGAGVDYNTDLTAAFDTAFDTNGAIQFAPNVRGITVGSDAAGTARTASTEDLYLIVEFNEAVDVDETGGTPTLTLTSTAGTGFNTDGVADYLSGSGTTDIVFYKAYEVGDDSTAMDLPTDLVLNSGTMVATAGSGAAVILELDTAGTDHATDQRTAAEAAIATDGGLDA